LILTSNARRTLKEMLTMTQVHDIRKLYFEEGRTISLISRTTGFDRKTVRRYLELEDFNQDIPTAQEKPSFPKLDPFKAEIDNWLTQDKKAKKKQRHSAKRVFDRLKDKYRDDFKISYRTVAGYVAQKKKDIYGKRAYLPLEHIPGEAQADFGDCQFYEKGKLYDGKYLNLSFPSSNKGYTQVYKGENAECLFEGLISIFSHIGGVPGRIWFDNASSTVAKVLKEDKRALTERFMRFKEHYGFTAAFCNIGAGHEKGNVEAKVGYHRRNMLVPVPRTDDLSSFNRELLTLCEKDGDRDHYRMDATHNELFEKDIESLLKLPATPFDPARYERIKTNGYGKFYLSSGLHEYSVSPKFVDSYITVKITATRVIPLDESLRPVTVHERLYGGSKQQSVNWLPYLTQLARCPGALKYSGIYKMLPDPLRDYLMRSGKGLRGRVLSAIAELTEKDGFEKAVETVKAAIDYEAADTDSLVNIHNILNSDSILPPPIKLPEYVPVLKKYVPQLSAYDRVLSKAGEK
jgi:transposase